MVMNFNDNSPTPARENGAPRRKVPSQSARTGFPRMPAAELHIVPLRAREITLPRCDPSRKSKVDTRSSGHSRPLRIRDFLNPRPQNILRLSRRRSILCRFQVFLIPHHPPHKVLYYNPSFMLSRCICSVLLPTTIEQNEYNCVALSVSGYLSFVQ